MSNNKINQYCEITKPLKCLLLTASCLITSHSLYGASKPHLAFLCTGAGGHGVISLAWRKTITKFEHREKVNPTALTLNSSFNKNSYYGLNLKLWVVLSKFEILMAVKLLGLPSNLECGTKTSRA